MPSFLFIARDKTGKKITGSEEGTNQEEIISRLQGRDLIVIKVSPETGDGLKSEMAVKVKSRRRHGGVNSSDIVIFCRQLATLLNAGITILKSLDIISKQVTSTKLYNVIVDLEKNMKEGLTFHEAMAKHPKVFSELWINLVESGEASGNLAVVLERLANYLERLEEFKKKIISSLIYPCLLFAAGMGALLFMTMKIIPTFAQLFEGFNIKLPLLTQMLLVVSNFIRKYALVMLVGGWIGIYLFRQYIKTTEGRRRFEKFCFDMPVMGDFFKAMIVERYSSEMSTLLESGVPILYSLEITEHSVGNLIVADIIRKVKESVRDGKPLSQPMEKSGFFEPMVVQMVAIGEEIGELPNMFRRINTFYQGVVETFLIRFTALFEPLMLVFMGAVIGLMVVGIFLPIFQIANVGGSGG